MTVRNHKYLEECLYSDTEWYLGDLSPEDDWFDIVGDFLFSQIQLKNVRVVKSVSQRKKQRAKGARQLVLNKTAKSDNRAISAYFSAVALAPAIEDFIRSEDTSIEFITMFGKYMEELGILRQRLKLQSYNRETSGKASAESGSLEAQRCWVCYWLQDNCSDLKNPTVAQEISNLSEIIYDIHAGKYKNLNGHKPEWFRWMLHPKKGDPEAALNESFKRIRRTDMDRILKEPEFSREELPPTSVTALSA